MAKNVNKIAEALGATVVGEVPDTGGGAFGMSRLAAILRTRLEPGQGRRPGAAQRSFMGHATQGSHESGNA